MNHSIRIQLLPFGKTIRAKRGASLHEILFAHGVEFPCGGRGRCKGCKVKLLHGSSAPKEEDVRLLSPAELAEGWRLACRAHAVTDLTIELAQWESAILSDNSAFPFTPRDGLGIAVDLGTTTIVAQLCDLRTGYVLAVRTGLNVQARHGADIMSRIEFAMACDGQVALADLIRNQIAGMIYELLASAKTDFRALRDVVIVGNTVMHHLFCKEEVAPLSHHPFESSCAGLHVFEPRQLGWILPKGTSIRFLPSLGSFVGSDILAGVLAANLHASQSLQLLVDLGTNGEIVLGNCERMLCASTAAGPAFEGARISMGMRAAQGAISEVRIANSQFECGVLGNAPPRGICGSGLVDAVACGLELGRIQPNGRLTSGERLVVAPPVKLEQSDIRELQLAKGAIAAGIRLLLDQWGATMNDVRRVFLAGAFGNYINRESARRIGLIQFPPDQVQPAGNTALLGAKLALFHLQSDDGSYSALRRKIQHVSLSDDARFQDAFVEEMLFPQ